MLIYTYIYPPSSPCTGWHHLLAQRSHLHLGMYIYIIYIYTYIFTNLPSPCTGWHHLLAQRSHVHPCRRQPDKLKVRRHALRRRQHQPAAIAALALRPHLSGMRTSIDSPCKKITGIDSPCECEHNQARFPRCATVPIRGVSCRTFCDHGRSIFSVAMCPGEVALQRHS